MALSSVDPQSLDPFPPPPMQPRMPSLTVFTSLVLLAASDLVVAQISHQRLSITNTSKVNYCQALPALLSYIPDSVEFEGRLRQAEPSAPPPTTTTPPPLISKSDCAVHTTLPAHNIIPHRPPDGRIALLPQQDHPSHRPALNARLHQRATPICLQLLVLVSQGRQPTAASAPAPSQGELAVQHLLKVVRSDASGTVPRDHRERVAHKLNPLSLDEPGSDFEDDALTPRLTTRRRPQ
ncbi:hypothetical protein EDB85DRAFT_2293470 [Lactarius pseudohatsudake]|nr:hypothetical protein EDB85DRAFT_2293470 [Lactarius pseudohatsudake]